MIHQLHADPAYGLPGQSQIGNKPRGRVWDPGKYKHVAHGEDYIHRSESISPDRPQLLE